MIVSFTLVTLWFLLCEEMSCKVINTKDEILHNENLPWDGKEYSFRYETKNGVNWMQSGKLKISENGTAFVGVSGKYSYPLDNGFIMSVEYEALDNGYQIKRLELKPSSKHILDSSFMSNDNLIKDKNPDENDDSLLDDRFTDSRVAATFLG